MYSMYLKDKANGVKYKITSSQIVGLTLIPTLSLFIYGMSLSLVLVVLNIPSSMILLILVLAFIVEAILQLFKKLSPGQLIACILTLIVLYGIMLDIYKRDFNKKLSAKQQIDDFVNVYNLTRSMNHFPVEPITA